MADEDAFVGLYRERYAPMVRLAYLMTGSQAVAEDLVQDAFVAVHRSWARATNPPAYLRAAVVNGCRSWGRRKALELLRRPAPPDPPTLVADELWDVLLTLPPRQRAAIVLRFYEDLPDEEIAALLGCKVPTVRRGVPGPGEAARGGGAMTDEDRDVREMLNRAAAGVEPSSDGLRKIEDKLAAAPRRRRRAPAMGVAAAVLVLALAGVLLVRDDDPDVRVATEPTTTVASTATSVPRTTTTMVDVVVQTYGIWPWPENDEFQSVAITGPVEVATGYVDAAVGITDATTISEYRAGDSMSGEVVFGGDIDTTVSVRDIGGAWNAVAASSELVSIEVGDDGTTSYSTAVAGELASSHSVPRGDAVTTGPTPVEAGTVGVDSASAGGAGDVARHRFTLRTDDGVTGLTEVRVERPVVAEPARVARDYVTSWVGMSSSTTMSELRATDATSGLIVFGGDLEATVRLRQVGGRWYVEASSTPLVEALEGSSPGEVRLIAREAGSLTVVMRSGDGRVVSSMPDRGVSAGEEVLVVPPSGTEPGTPLSVRYVLHTSRPAPESELSVSGIGEVHVVW